MPVSRPLVAVSTLAAAALLLGGCSSADAPAAAEGGATVTVQDNYGEQQVPAPPTSVVALDNGSFQTLADWGVTLTAASVSLMPDTIAYTKDASISDVGNHREPDLEKIAAARPDLVISGGRFGQYREDIVALVPDATVVELDPRDGEPFDAELRRGTLALGEIFDKKTEAAKLVADFDASIERVKAAYDPAQTVMAVTTTGGEIGYLAPKVGRTLGPVFEFAGLTPALEVEGSTDDHQGDDISVEAIAQSNPDWILVMDRDAAVAADDPAYKPAADVLEGSPVLEGVTAVREGQIVYMPADTYTNESIQTYTEFLNAFADALESKS